METDSDENESDSEPAQNGNISADNDVTTPKKCTPIKITDSDSESDFLSDLPNERFLPPITLTISWTRKMMALQRGKKRAQLA